MGWKEWLERDGWDGWAGKKLIVLWDDGTDGLEEMNS